MFLSRKEYSYTSLIDLEADNREQSNNDNLKWCSVKNSSPIFFKFYYAKQQYNIKFEKLLFELVCFYFLRKKKRRSSSNKKKIISDVICLENNI